MNLKNIISNGDDYQILFTGKKNNREKILKYSKISKVRVTRIGLITRDKKLKTKNHGKVIDFSEKKMGYTHNFWEDFCCLFSFFLAICVFLIVIEY